MPSTPPKFQNIESSPAAGERSSHALLRQIEAMQAQILSMRAMLEHHERLATLGTIAGLIAHEFNNILTPVLSYAQMAIAKPDDAELTHKALLRATEGTERAAAISSAILGFVRDDSRDTGGDVPRGTSCLVSTAVREALACMGRELVRDGIELVEEIDEALRAAMRPIALQHVVLNLLLNARKAMLPAGGRMTIRAFHVEHPPVAQAGDAIGVVPDRAQTQRIHGWVVLEISDTGHGMDAGQLARVFQPFYSVSVQPSVGASGERRSGTGLGMTICARLVGDAGGILLARSQKSRGTTVVVSVPAA